MKSHAYENARELLGKIGFNILRKEPSISIPEGQIKIDLLAENDSQTYAVEVTETSSLDSFLKTTFFRAVVRLRAVNRIKEDWNPMIVLLIRSTPPEQGKRIKKRFDLYAPDVEWICGLPDREPLHSFDSNSGTKKREITEKNISGTNHQTSLHRIRKFQEKTHRAGLVFSDLRLWLFKCLYYNHHASEYDRGDSEGTVHNGHQLAKHAEVSSPTVYNWINEMEQEGYLDRIKRKSLLLQKTEECLGRWRERYRIRDNEDRIRLQFIKNVTDPYEALLDRLSDLPEEDRARYVLTGHPAARMYGVSVTSADRIHLFRRNSDRDRLREDLGLIEADAPDGKLISYRPTYPEAVFRAHQTRDKVPVVDPIQLYLDCYHLSDRGREQARTVREKVLP